MKSKLPKEIEEYYTAEKRERRGVAGLLAVGTLLVTILLAVGLFFGGRWAYRSIRHEGKKASNPPTSATSSTSTDTPSSDDDNKVSTGWGGADGTSATEKVSTALSNAGKNNSSSTTNNNMSNGTGNGTAKSGLPNTGPADMLPLIILVTVGGVLVAEVYNYRKQTR